MKTRFRRILETCEPYVVASPLGPATKPRPLPLGLHVRPELHFDPHRTASATFLNALQRLDELSFGPVGLSMPRWVFYDCAEIPGGIFGFSRPAAQVPEWVLRALHVDARYAGPVPLSLYVAIPMLEPGSWHTFTLCSLNEVAPGAAPAGTGLLTEALGLEAFGIRRAHGATQWRSRKLRVHALFGPLELLTAWTPAHSDPRTLTFRFEPTAETIGRVLRGEVDEIPPDAPGVRWIDCDDDDVLQDLQAELEAGRRYAVLGPARIDGSYVTVPIRAIDAPEATR